jgi:superfamily II DNA/RNA helicase
MVTRREELSETSPGETCLCQSRTQTEKLLPTADCRLTPTSDWIVHASQIRQQRTMEALLGHDNARKGAPRQSPAVNAALQRLALVLQEAIPLLKAAGGEVGDVNHNNVSSVSASWLMDVCSQVPSELETSYLARSVWEASQLPGEAQQQAALFDALGASEEAMNVLMQVAPKLLEIRTIQPNDLNNITNNISEEEIFVDLEEERRQLLLREAMDAAQVAAVAQAELEEQTQRRVGTHTVTRASDLHNIKFAEKAKKRAAQALQRAKDAGALVDESDLIAIDRTALGAGGLQNRTQEEVLAIQRSLLPDGTLQYYDNRGLPSGTIVETKQGYERALIPATPRDEENLHPRLHIADILDEDSARMFDGVPTLNPMQSAVFDVAFNSRENLLVCAPTGAGKTNVALLAVAAHFRDVGLIGSSRMGLDDTGDKIVYIAPMKALAQEVVEKFSSKLKPLKLIVRELTGDMQLTRAEAASANLIVMTPEKFDVVTRKSGTDENSLGNKCGLIIIDEVHLLADERGAVIESIVSRLHRLVESRQRQIRIVALSATLPNYDDVATFLQVSERGLFYFGPEHRPVPLQQEFLGVHLPKKGNDRNEKEKRMNDVCFEVVIDSLRRGHQVMVFVHSRKGTGDTAKSLAELAANEGALEHFFMTRGKDGLIGDAYKRYCDRALKSRNREVSKHFENGMGIHHAGMLRGDRKLTEQMFYDGAIRVLCCTATLAWGVNLPAHTVVIKGTEVYNPEKGGRVDLSILDVQQIFGRAGRPQFDTFGEATLITTQDAFSRYLNKLVRAVPIESNFIKQRRFGH